VDRINRLLFEHEAGYEIRPPDLISRNPQTPIVVPQRTASLDEQAQEIIQKSLKASEQFLAEGRDRQAVQEIPWLLETVSTAFRASTQGRAPSKENISTKLLRILVGATGGRPSNRSLAG
jgi:hypothetical protein